MHFSELLFLLKNKQTKPKQQGETKCFIIPYVCTCMYLAEHAELPIPIHINWNWLMKNMRIQKQIWKRLLHTSNDNPITKNIIKSLNAMSLKLAFFIIENIIINISKLEEMTIKSCHLKHVSLDWQYCVGKHRQVTTLSF